MNGGKAQCARTFTITSAWVWLQGGLRKDWIAVGRSTVAGRAVGRSIVHLDEDRDRPRIAGDRSRQTGQSRVREEGVTQGQANKKYRETADVAVGCCAVEKSMPLAS